MRRLIIGLICVSIFASCVNKDNKGEAAQQNIEETAPPDSLTTKPVEEVKERTNLEMLQGRWQHTQDTTNYIAFDQNIYREIVIGITDWSNEQFTLSNKCTNKSDKDSNLTSSSDKYISLTGSNRCFYIIKLDSNELSLSYVGRGNTLTYKKEN